MQEYPCKFMISSGAGRAEEKLVSFDNALIEARISNFNLLKVSSILPASCKQAEHIDIPEGSALLTAYGTFTSGTPGEVIASAVGIGIPERSGDIGIIMEYAGVCSKEYAETLVYEMVRKAMDNHGICCKEIKCSSIEKIVREGEFVTVISAVTLW